MSFSADRRGALAAGFAYWVLKVPAAVSCLEAFVLGGVFMSHGPTYGVLKVCAASPLHLLLCMCWYVTLLCVYMVPVP